MVLSIYAGVSLEDIAKCAPEGLRWLNISVTMDRNDIKEVVQRAEDAGYKGIFVTCDRPVPSIKRALRPLPDELKRNEIR